MDFKKVLFSSEGRINRQPFIIAYLIIMVINGVIQGVSAAAELPIIYILMVVTVYMFIMIGIKRAHDRDRSGWFVVVAFIPILNIWPFIEFVFLKGTQGENRFGADPLGAPQTTA